MTDENDGRAKGMVRRQEVDCLRRNREKIHTVRHIQNDISLRQHNALALPGCSGSENNRRHAVHINRIVVIGVVPAGTPFCALYSD